MISPIETATREAKTTKVNLNSILLSVIFTYIKLLKPAKVRCCCCCLTDLIYVNLVKLICPLSLLDD